MNKYSIMGTATISALVLGIGLMAVPIESADAARQNCRAGVANVCVATDSILQNARVGVGVCAQVLSNHPTCTGSVE